MFTTWMIFKTAEFAVLRPIKNNSLLASKITLGAFYFVYFIMECMVLITVEHILNVKYCIL